MPKHNDGIADMNEIFDVLDDIISDDVEVDSAPTKTSNLQYDELFRVINSELYHAVSSFSSLNFLVKLMHLKLLNK